MVELLSPEPLHSRIAGRHRGTIRLGDELSSDALNILLEAGLKHGATDAVAQYKSAVGSVNTEINTATQRDLNVMITHIESNSATLCRSIEEYLMHRVIKKFPYVIVLCLTIVRTLNFVAVEVW